MKIPSRTVSLLSTSAPQTQKVGKKLARLLRPGDVAVLLANLGAGKTTLVQGLAAGAGVDEQALSPTFILAQTLPGRRYPVHHMDFYRLNKAEILGIGIEDYLRGAGEIAMGVVLIEWAERCREIWPKERLEIRLKILKSGARRISLTGIGARYADMAKKFMGRK